MYIRFALCFCLKLLFCGISLSLLLPTDGLTVETQFDDASASAVQYIHMTTNNKFDLEEDANLNIKAFLSAKNVSRRVVTEQVELKKPRNKFIKCLDLPCTKTWKYDLQGRALNLENFSTLQLAWSQLLQPSSPKIDLKIALENNSGNKDTEPVFFIGKYGRSEEFQNPVYSIIDFDAADFIERSNFYILKRELGLKEDKRWRYYFDNEKSVLQSRLDEPLEKFQIVQIVTDKSFPPDLVNFIIDTGGWMGGTIIKYHETEKFMEERGDLAILTIDLSNAIKRAGIDLNRAVLLEPIIFFTVDIPTFLKEKPLKKIILSKSIEDSTDNRQLEIIPKFTQRNHKYFLDFDFDKFLDDKLMKDRAFRSVEITVEYDDKPQIFQMDSIKLCRSHTTSVPKVTERINEAMASWGDGAIPVEPLENLISFKPLISLWRRQIKTSDPIDRLTNRPHETKQMATRPFSTWYRLNASFHKVSLDGIFTTSASSLEIDLSPFERETELKFYKERDNVDVILKKRGDQKIDLPIALLSENNSITIPEATACSFVVIPKGVDSNVNDTQKIHHSYKKWKMTLESTRGGGFAALEIPVTRGDKIVEKLWRSPLTSQSDFIYPVYLRNNQFYEGGTELSRKLKGGSKALLKELSDIDQDVNLSKSHLPASIEELFGNQDDKLTLFSIEKNENIGDDSFVNSQWWYRERLLPLTPMDRSVVVDARENKAYQLAMDRYISKWSFKLPDSEFVFPIGIVLPESYASFDKIALISGGKRSIILPENTREISLLDLDTSIDDIVLEVQTHQDKKVMHVDLPQIKVFGSKHTLQKELAQEGLLINGKFFDLPEISSFKSQWVDFGHASLKKGHHIIHNSGNSIVNLAPILVTSASAITKAPANDGQVLKSIASRSRISIVSISVFLGIGSFIVWLLFLIYRPLVYHLMNTFKDFYNSYFKVISVTSLVGYLVCAIGLYYYALISGKQLVYDIIFADMFILIFIQSINTLIKKKGNTNNFYLKRLLLFDNATFFLGWGILFFLIMVFFAFCNLNLFAEQIAVIGYYCVLLGLIGKLFILKSSSVSEQKT